MKGLPREWLIAGLENSARILDHVLADVSQERARAIRDGAEGWSVLEIICHLRDYQAIFATRIARILEEDNPSFVAYDEAARLAMVIDNNYAGQDLRRVFDDYRATRRRLVDRLSSLSEDKWARMGSFAADDQVDIWMVAAHTLLHDCNHTEQIARILRQQDHV